MSSLLGLAPFSSVTDQQTEKGVLVTSLDTLTARLRDASPTDNPYVGEGAEERIPNATARAELARTFVPFAHAAADVIEASVAAGGTDLALDHFETTAKAIRAASLRDFLLGLVPAETAVARFEVAVDGTVADRA